jgi:hypothetical protein
MATLLTSSDPASRVLWTRAREGPGALPSRYLASLASTLDILRRPELGDVNVLLAPARHSPRSGSTWPTVIQESPWDLHRRHPGDTE